MQVLTKYWYKEFSAYELAKEAQITAPMSYKSIENLTKYDLVTKKATKVQINFNSQFSYQFKLLQDAEKLTLLSEEIKDKVNHIQRVLQAEYQNDLLAFLIFGSVASGETTKDSDLDVLAIVTEKKDFSYEKRGLLNLGKINIIEKSKKEWESDYLLAHDLVLNALINGIIIYDQSIIRHFLQKPLPSPSYEMIMQKKERLDVLRKRLLLLLKDQDYASLEQEFKQFLIEKARIILLQKGIVPSSKKDILTKIKSLDAEIYKQYNLTTIKNIKVMVDKYV
jgi:predicted nucleotidyltransferase